MALGLKLAFHLERTPDEPVERIVVEVGIGDCCEQGIDHLMVGISLRSACATQSIVENGYASCDIKQQIHSGRSLGQFTAYSTHSATGTFGCFLTLIAEHLRGCFHVLLYDYMMIKL